MIFRIVTILFFLGCTSPKETTKSNLNPISGKPNLPVWIEYSKSVPDSLQDFTKLYLQSKQFTIIGMKEAMEMIMSNSNASVMNKIQNGNLSSDREITDLVEQSMKKPVCSKLGIRVFANEKNNRAYIDSVLWNVVLMPPGDTSLRIRQHIFYPPNYGPDKVYTIWKGFIDAILSSGILK